MITCESCHAPIIWVKTTAGGQMPLDFGSARDGTILIAYANPNARLGVVLTGKTLDWAREQGAVLYRSHFASCPDADEWRRESRRNRAAQPEGGTE